MDPIASVAGLVFASLLFFYFVQLDKQREVVAELPPQDENDPIALRRRSFGYRLDRFGRRFLGNRVAGQRVSTQVKLNLAGNPGHLTPAAFEAIRYGVAAALVALPLLVGLLLGLPVSGLIAAVIGGGGGVSVARVPRYPRGGGRRAAGHPPEPDGARPADADRAQPSRRRRPPDACRGGRAQPRRGDSR